MINLQEQEILASGMDVESVVVESGVSWNKPCCSLVELVLRTGDVTQHVNTTRGA
jgi:hypothetical protein